MSNENLPLLPDPWAQSVTSPVVNYYTAEQMQAYARAAIAQAEQRGEAVPQGWNVSHPEPWDALTEEAQRENRIHVSRNAAPYCGPDGVRIWTATTLEEALEKGYRALGLEVPKGVLAQSEHEREKAGTPRKESASSIRLQMILQLLDDPEHDFTATDMEYWDTLHDRVQATAREKFEAQALREDVEGLVKEYRPTMPAEVLHLWARDVVSAIKQQEENV